MYTIFNCFSHDKKDSDFVYEKKMLVYSVYKYSSKNLNVIFFFFIID